MENKINSALALTKTRSLQQYHVFAYKVNKDVKSDDLDSIFGCIIILASFGGDGSTDEEARSQAALYARSLNTLCDYPLIFYTSTHRWFELKRRPQVDIVHYVDDKSALTNVKNFMNREIIEKFEKDLQEKKERDALVEEERKRIRKQNNPDNIEHFICCAQSIVRIDSELAELRATIEEKEKVLEEEKEKLRIHRSLHEKHERESLILLSDRMKKEEYDFFAINYNRLRKDIFRDDEKGEERGERESGKGERSGKSGKGERSGKGGRSGKGERSRESGKGESGKEGEEKTSFYVKKVKNDKQEREGNERESFWSSSGAASLSDRWVRSGGEKEERKEKEEEEREESKTETGEEREEREERGEREGGEERGEREEREGEEEKGEKKKRKRNRRKRLIQENGLESDNPTNQELQD